MRKTFLLIALFSFSLFAQKIETLAGGDEMIIGGFGGPTFQATSIAGETAFLMGGEGAMIVNHTFGVGGAGYGLINEIERNDNSVKSKIKFGYGGVKFYYVSNYDKLFHFTAALLIGAGGINEEEKDVITGHEEENETDKLFLLIPALGVEMNVTKIFRIEFAAKYRYVNGVDLENYSDKDFSGLTISLFFKFGRF
jgi:hypothetical protein